MGTKARSGEVWPRGSDHLFSCWAFTLSLHSLWTLPMMVVQHGGLAFLLIYTTLVMVLGAPLLLLELALGQYSALPPARLFRHLCPLLAGLGLAFTLLATLRGMLDLAVLMWSGQGLFHLFSSQAISEGFLSREILGQEEATLQELGGLRNQVLLVLGIAALSTFVFLVAGTKSVGKVSMVAVPLAYMLLVTLTIRACLGEGVPQGVLDLLTPNWAVLTMPTVWLEAAAHVVFSLQLGIGALTTFASYSKYSHSLVRDAAILAGAHLAWVALTTILTLALLELARVEGEELLQANPGTGVLLAASLGETAWTALGHGWLWAGLYLILVIIIGITSMFGYVEVITSSIVSLRQDLTKFKPLVAFMVVALLFLLDLVLATQGGITVYHLLTTFISTWPTLLFSLLTVVAALLCHGTSHLMRDLEDMARQRLHHWVSSHLSVIYYSFLPAVLTVSIYPQPLTPSQASLAWTLYRMAGHGPALAPAWALAALPLAPLLLGALVHMAWLRRGVPLAMVGTPHPTSLTHQPACEAPGEGHRPLLQERAQGDSRHLQGIEQAGRAGLSFSGTNVYKMEITSVYMSHRGLGGGARRSALQGRWRVWGLWAWLGLLGARLDLLGARLDLLGEPGGTGELLGAPG